MPTALRVLTKDNASYMQLNLQVKFIQSVPSFRPFEAGQVLQKTLPEDLPPRSPVSVQCAPCGLQRSAEREEAIWPGGPARCVNDNTRRRAVDPAISLADCFFIWRDQSSGQCSVSAHGYFGRRRRRRGSSLSTGPPDTWAARRRRRRSGDSAGAPCVVFVSIVGRSGAARVL